jgi:hypothetical protein
LLGQCIYHSSYCTIVGTEAPDASLNEERKSANEDSGTSVIYNPNRSLSIEQQRQRLPVFIRISQQLQWMQSDSYMYHRLLDLKMATIYRELYLFVCLYL